MKKGKKKRLREAQVVTLQEIRDALEDLSEQGERLVQLLDIMVDKLKILPPDIPLTIIPDEQK